MQHERPHFFLNQLMPQRGSSLTPYPFLVKDRQIARKQDFPEWQSDQVQMESVT